MRKLFTLFLFLVIAHSYTSAQADTIRLSEMSKGPKIVTDRPPQALYFQLGGSGPILSANYDRRFNKTLNGAGFAVGLGYWRDWGISMVSVPVSLNYLIGRKTHFVELAGGTTFMTASTLDWYDEEGTTESAFVHHFNLGYRHQPAAGGFFFRGGFSPLFGGGEAYMSFYLGFGYNF